MEWWRKTLHLCSKEEKESMLEWEKWSGSSPKTGKLTMSSLPPQNQLRDEDLYRGRLPSSGSSANKIVCNQCHQAYWPRSKQGQETPNDATKVFKDIFIYCYHFQFCIFLVQIFQNELLEHGVVVFLWWAWSWGQPRTFELPGQSREGPRDEPKQEEELDEEDVPDPAKESQDDPPEDSVDAPEEAPESIRRKERRRKLFLHKEVRKGFTRWSSRRGDTRCSSRPCRCSRRSSGGQEEERRWKWFLLNRRKKGFTRWSCSKWREEFTSSQRRVVFLCLPVKS